MRVARVNSRTSRIALVCAVVASAITVMTAAARAATNPPTQPGAVTASNVTSSASLSWQASQDVLGIEGYRISLSRNGGPFRQVATTDGGITKYNLQTLFANSTYDVTVVALDSSAQTSAPGTTSISTPTVVDTTAPVPPSDSSVAAHWFSATRIDVVWGGSSSTDAVGYLVLRDGVQVAEIDLPGGLRYSDNGLTPSTTYRYTIEAIDSAGNVSAPTTNKAASTATTPAAGTVSIRRGPYLSDVTATSAIVSWWTNIPTNGTVAYGAGALTSTANDPAGAVQHHAVQLSNLTAGTSYQYTVGDGTVASTPATFSTAAAPGGTYSFAAIGDFGGGSPGESQNAANIAADGTSFIQTLGDNIYPASGAPDPDFSTVYSDFDARMFKPFAAALRTQPFFPANGNQEYYSDGAFWSTFPTPGTNHSWYSYDWGDAHILVLDSELAIDPSSPQYAFAQSDLAAHQGARFRIVAVQKPPYSSTSATSSARFVRQYLVPLFEQEHVALVLSGNSHNYERSVPLLGGNSDPNGITYVVSGGGGNGHNTFTQAAPVWSAARDDVRYEFVKVTVSPTALHVEAIDAATNAAFDSATINAPAPPTSPGTVVPVTPHTVLDTAHGVGAAQHTVAPHSTVTVPVTGSATGVPADAAGVLLSVGTSQVATSGSVAVYGNGTPAPPNGNVAAIASRPSVGEVLVPLGSDGNVALTNTSAGTLNLLADVIGYVRGGPSGGVAGAAVFTASHEVLNTATGVGAVRQALPAHTTVRFAARGGSTGVPSGAGAALVTVRAWQVRRAGGVAAFPDGGRARGQNLAALVGAPTVAQLLLPIGRDGKVALTNTTAGTMQLAATVSGFVQRGTSSGIDGAVVPIAAHQVLGTAAGIGAPRGALASQHTLQVAVTGGGVPSKARAVIINLSSWNATSTGAILAYAAGAAQPTDPSIEAVAGGASYGQVVVPVGTGGAISLTNATSGPVDLAGYVVGYVGGS